MGLEAWRRWRARRRLQAAAKLFRRGKLARHHYVTIAIESIAILSDEDVERDKGWDSLTFGVEARLALGMSAGAPAEEIAPKYGPLEFAFLDATDSKAGARSHVRITPGTFFSIAQARRRLRPWNRFADLYESWFAEEAKRMPVTMKLLLAIASLLAAFLLGRATK